MRRFRWFAAAAALGSLLTIPAVSFAQDDNTILELLRADIRTEHRAIIAAAMTFTETQSTAFWPIFNRYATDARKVYDERVAIMKDYAAAVDSLTDKNATSLVQRSLKAEADMTKLKDKYFKEISKAVGPKLAGKFMQYESTLLRIVDLQLGIVGLAIPEMSKP